MTARPTGFIPDLCVALAHRWEPERIFLILTAYLDESGTHVGSPATIMSGIMGTANQWARFQTDIAKIKRRHGFKIFHAKDLRSRSGEFARWSDDKVAALLDDMFRPSSKLMETITVSLSNTDYDDYYRGKDNPRRLRLDTKYGLCFRFALLNFAIKALKRLGTHKRFKETVLNIVMEDGHKNAGDAVRVFGEMAKELRGIGVNLLHGITFASKDGCDPLMIADYLAFGGLKMELAGQHDRPRRERSPSPEDRRETASTIMKVKPEYLTSLKAELLEQLKRTGRTSFIGWMASSSGQSA